MDVEFKNQTEFLDLLPFPCALLDDHFCIDYMNNAMSAFIDIDNARNQIKAWFESIADKKNKTISSLKSSYFEGKTKCKLIIIKGNNGILTPILMYKLGKDDITRNFESYVLLGITTHGLSLIKDFIIQRDYDDKMDFRSNKYLRIINNAVIGIIIFDKKLMIEEVNQSFADQLGTEKTLLIGKSIIEVFSNEISEKLNHFIELLAKEKYTLVKDVITIERENDEHKILEISISTFRDGEEKIDKFMLISEDITKQQDSNAALIKSEKLALTGRLAASLAHEINNPLQTSIGCLGLVEEMLDEDQKKQDLGVYVNMAMSELKRSARIVKRLRDLNRRTDPSERTPVDLQKMIDDVLILTKNRLYDRNIIPVFPYHGEPPLVLAAKDQIQQVLLNIVINAIDAMPQGGYLYFDLIHEDEPKGIFTTIRDTGVGMDQDVMDHLFDPFFTTKEDGLGLGLFICKRIIEEHGGHLDVDSKPGKGTIFTLWLPYCAESESLE
jgi:PAS domain S-box-containing protein